MLSAVIAVGVVGTVTLTYPEVQDMIPMNKWGGPCCKGPNCNEKKWAGCTGGFPGVNAVYRDEEARAGPDGTVMKLGMFLQQNEQLVDEHPTNFSVNADFWDTAAVDGLLVPAPYVYGTSLPTAVDAVLFLQGRSSESQFSAVASNLADTSSPLRGLFKPYTIVEKNGYRIGVLNTFTRSSWVGSVSVIPYVRNLVRLVRSMDVDCVVMIIGYSQHFDADQIELAFAAGADVIAWGRWGTGELYEPFNSVRRTEKRFNPELNHTTWLFQVQNTAMPHSGMRSIDLDFEDEADGRRRLVGVNIRLRTSLFAAEERDAQYHQDEVLVERLLNETSESDAELGFSTRVLPTGFKQVAEVHTCREDDCELGSWTTDVLLKYSKEKQYQADIALVNGGGLRAGWDEGPIMRSELNAAVPYKNLLCYVPMTAADLYIVLEHGYAAVGEDGKYNVTAPVTGRYLQLSGLRVHVNPTLPAGERVTAMETKQRLADGTEAWQPIDPLVVYTIVTLGYLCEGGDRYTFTPAPDTDLHVSEVSWWSVMAEELKTEYTFTPYLRDAVVYDMAGKTLKTFRGGACSELEEYIPRYRVCWPCAKGYYRPHDGVECVVRPVPANVLMIVLPVVIGLVFVMIVGAVLLVLYRRYTIARLVRFAPKNPDAPITFLFTDIQMSTDLWANFPNAMKTSLASHHLICRGLLEKHEGYEVKTIGDAFFCAFQSSSSAVAFALEFQIELVKAAYPKSFTGFTGDEGIAGAIRTVHDKDGQCIFNGLRVRIGVHTDTTTTTTVVRTPNGGYDYEGNAVNVAARVSDSGCGGQVILTQQAYDAVQESLNELSCACEVEYLGAYSYRGVESAIQIHSILPEQFAERSRYFAPLRGCTRQVAEDESASESGSFALSNPSALSAPALASVETIRRWARKGVTAASLATALADSMDATEIDQTLLQSMLGIIAIETAVAPSTNGSRRALRQPVSSTKAQGMPLRWPPLLKILQALPEVYVNRFAAHILGQSSSIPSSSCPDLLNRFRAAPPNPLTRPTSQAVMVQDVEELKL